MSEDRVLELQEFIFKEVQEHGWENETFDSFVNLTFQSPKSLRLRLFGYGILKDVYKNEEFPLEERLTGRELLTLRDCVGYPYYLPANHSRIILFTVKQSFVLKLNGGDVKKWLKNLANKSL